MTPKSPVWIATLSLMIIPATDAPAFAADRAQKICEAKESEYKSRKDVTFIACDAFDSGIEPIRSSYQPRAAEPLKAPPSVVNKSLPEADYRNRFKTKGVDGKSTSYLKGMADEMDAKYEYEITDAVTGKTGKVIEKGRPLAFRFLDVIDQKLAEIKERYDADPKRYGDEYNHFKRMRDWAWSDRGWLAKFNSVTGAHRSSGRCYDWSRMQDPKLLEGMAAIEQAISCFGFPFSKEEMEELALGLYELPLENYERQDIGIDKWYSVRNSNRLFTGAGLSMDGPDTHRKQMDANVAFSKLGLLGDGSMNPSQMLKDFKKYKTEKNWGASFDRDHGQQVWNHPVVAMADTSYQNKAKGDATGLLPTEHLVLRAGASAENVERFLSLKRQELALTLALMEGKGLPGSNQTLTEQAETLRKMKVEMVEKGVVQPVMGGTLSAVLHDLVIEYAVESQFASRTKPENVQRSFLYTDVIDGQKQVVKSIWSPPVTLLSDFCRDPVQVAAGFAGFSEMNAKAMCEALESGKVKDYEVFSGSVPPRKIYYFERKPQLNRDSRAAYDFFLSLLPQSKNAADQCPLLDGIVHFAEDFAEAISDNELTADDIARFQKIYPGRKHLDPVWVERYLCADGVKGLDGPSGLRQALLKDDPSLCKGSKGT